MASWIDLLAGAPNPSDVGSAFADGQRQAFALQAAKQQQLNQQNELARTAQYRSQLGDLLRGGNLTGAAAAAAAYGDDKAATNFITLQKNRYDQGAAGAGAMSDVVRGIASLPYEQRSAAIQAAKPVLRSMGYHDADIDAFDPSDANLAAVGGLGYTAHDRVSDANTGYENQTKRIEATNPKVVGNSLVGLDGHELYRAPDYINSPAGSSLYRDDGTTGSLSPDDAFSRMINVESGGNHFSANGQPLTSGKGAVGIAQVMPATAPEAARMAGLPFDENRYRNDPQYNLALGKA